MFPSDPLLSHPPKDTELKKWCENGSLLVAVALGDGQATVRSTPNSSLCNGSVLAENAETRTTTEVPIPPTADPLKFLRDTSEALQRGRRDHSSIIEQLGMNTVLPALKGRDILTKDVIIGFELVKRKSSSLFKEGQEQAWPVARMAHPAVTQYLELYVERQQGIPSLRQSHIQLLTTKGKGYGPVFILDATIEKELCETLATLHREATTLHPVLATTIIKATPQSKPVSTPLGRLFEATAMLKTDDLKHTAEFYDFGVDREDYIQPDN